MLSSVKFTLLNQVSRTPHCSGALLTIQLLSLTLQGKVILLAVKQNEAFLFSVVAALTYTCHVNWEVIGFSVFFFFSSFLFFLFVVNLLYFDFVIAVLFEGKSLKMSLSSFSMDRRTKPFTPPSLMQFVLGQTVVLSPWKLGPVSQTRITEFDGTLCWVKPQLSVLQ